ncbi:hypothetical protein CANARDRAFT_145776 [[Candida] arabinofermentans NRRL YB-2248]|uniref:Uncharacterized protein n=1 Tax=[Candida] arabinofermentans NRRL YB-2248 TaxID=983967 RepID=A0A1E4T2E1_9ASCO|nr:hypothetical protein CANARDRAFT_145776 [[Candida] arabinofermentans NRRL YB-2248]
MVNILTSLAPYLSILPFVSQHNNKETWQQSHDQTNLLKHCGGMGPYVQGTGYGIPLSLTDTDAAKVDQVIAFARHGERYPTSSVGLDLKRVFEKLKNTKVDAYQGPLSFVRDWEYFVSDDSLLEMETNSSRFSGLLDMYNFGQTVRSQYSDLYKNGTKLPFFAASGQRVVDSAESFAKGFFLGDEKEFEEYAALQILPEKRRQGANTLTTGRSCAPYSKYDGFPSRKTSGIFKSGPFLKKEAQRLNELSPGFDLTKEDVYALLTYCPFELNYRGYSEVCNALSMEAFMGLEYLRDVELWYTKANHPYTLMLGSVYINATLSLMEQGPENLDDQALWFSFSHDTDLLYYLNALTVLDYQTKDLSTKHIDFGRFFKVSELIPMGARIVLERLSASDGEKYVRVIVNDAVIPLAHCHDGPGFSCNLKQLRFLFEKRLKGKTYAEECEVKAKHPQYLSFYWDWKDGRYE